MIEQFETLKAVAIPLDRGNVDTDAIIPARFLKTIKRTGLGEGLFHAWRFDETGKEVPGFTLNMLPYRGGKILVAGENFGWSLNGQKGFRQGCARIYWSSSYRGRLNRTGGKGG